MTREATWVVDQSAGVVTITMPLRLESLLNLREHWSKRSKRAKQHRFFARRWVEDATREARRWLVPSKVTITRIAPRKLDSDGVVASGKSVRDGVADALGVDDGDSAVIWYYNQRKGKPREYAVEVRLE